LRIASWVRKRKLMGRKLTRSLRIAGRVRKIKLMGRKLTGSLRIASKVRKIKLMGRKKMKNMELLQEEHECRHMTYHSALNITRSLQKFYITVILNILIQFARLKFG
jgi:hypothetical protein